MALVLSVLDQVPVPAGSTVVEALRSSVDLAVAAERLGFARYWAAEHHNTASLACASPEILVAAVAARTRSIRVGSGGVLLPHYSPLKVAESFRLLDALYPGRIDLGVGRAAGTDPVTEAALQYRPGALGDEHFVQKVVDLLGFLDGALEDDHPYAGVRAVPEGPGGPDVWILGSSSQGAACAAYLGLPFAFAHFITPEFGPQIVRAYRKGFDPSGARGHSQARAHSPAQGAARAQASAAVTVMCADSDAEANRLATSVAVWRLRPKGRERGLLLRPEDAAALPLSDVQRSRVDQYRRGMVVGGPERVRDELVGVAGALDVEELDVLTVCHDPAARMRSYELLAEVFGLNPAPSG